MPQYFPFLLIMSTVFMASGASARPASLEGKWRLNFKESELLPGDSKPAELVMTITQDDANGFLWSASVKMPDGAGGVTGFAGAIDGKPYPITGRPGSTSSFIWMPDGALKQVSQSAGGIAVEICTFSADARKMICNVRQTDSSGRAASYSEVFDRG